VVKYATPDLGYIVEIERFRARQQRRSRRRGVADDQHPPARRRRLESRASTRGPDNRRTAAGVGEAELAGIAVRVCVTVARRGGAHRSCSGRLAAVGAVAQLMVLSTKRSCLRGHTEVPAQADVRARPLAGTDARFAWKAKARRVACSAGNFVGWAFASRPKGGGNWAGDVAGERGGRASLLGDRERGPGGSTSGRW